MEKCLAEATVDNARDDDVDAMALPTSEYVFAEKTVFLYAYFIGKLKSDLHGFEV